MRLLIYGSRGFARIVGEIAVACGREVAGFIDDFGSRGTVGTFDQTVATCSPVGHEIVIAVGYKDLGGRWACYQRALAAGYQVPPLVHPAAIVAPTAIVRPGAIVMAGANADSFATLGELCVLWPGVIVSHDVEVGRNSFLSPGAIVCGNSRVGEHCFIGAGAVVVDHERVPDRSFIKAGARFPKSGHAGNPGERK